uniref:Uncharacterized protein n=1 Tax=Ditylum brightwellii TaxID=49249 RepID=A0A6V2F2W4_9STRA|mmetsp:Transcript_7936/g.11850  ORF Transcript_7936/g.11850 Transcript_7936/m.11850 type:complete len:125 (+) Transcript_7936:50-424(+)
MSTPTKRSAGEELFLVHLHRQEGQESDPDAEDDHDYPEKRLRSCSVGEELYQIHLKRSQGLEDSADGDGETSKPLETGSPHQDGPSKDAILSKDEATEITQTSTKKTSGHELHLRSRNVPVESQ